jgi:hypothetical protein
VKTSNLIGHYGNQRKKNATIFVKTRIGVERIFKFFNDSRNNFFLQKLYEGTPYISSLVPIHVLEEFNQMKKKNRLSNTVGQLPLPIFNSYGPENTQSAPSGSGYQTQYQNQENYQNYNKSAPLTHHQAPQQYMVKMNYLKKYFLFKTNNIFFPLMK